ncbi:Aste57867_1216 [Aphanomyces stellatus]|uniref:Aste57867_1216 protein n=1 Tax=Aphanomyces stellatus TaxID=120398 RepID=A0A485K7B9_9STRA|nr:hypothetical protein As57867_001215 [Aphanomyces stellatus]VFT78436.1 Aste57867_1216 [Aphanomyces stellatus]
MGMARNTTAVEITKKKDGKKEGKKGNANKAVEIDYASLDHPYVVILNKKLRSFKKKQEKIKSLEDSMKGQSKQLNEQQLEVLSNKVFVEKMCAELETLRQQFVESLQAGSSSSGDATSDNKEDDTPPASGDEGVDTSSLNHLNEDVSDGKDVEDMVNDLEEDLKPASTTSAVASSTSDEDEKLEYVHSILKLLHAVSLHQALGHDVPMALDYFVKVLMGGTRPPAEVSFPENLAESMEEAKKYVYKSEKIVALDMSYRHLADTVDKLVAPKVPVVVEETHINFFTESELEKEENDKATAAALAVEEQPVVEGDVVQDAEKTSPSAKSSKRPNSGNRRHKNSPREGGNPATAANGEGQGDKPQKPRKVYQPRPKSQNGEHPEGGRAPRVAYVPKATNPNNMTTPTAPNGGSPTGGDKSRPASRRPNTKPGNGAARPKKVDHEVTP